MVERKLGYGVVVITLALSTSCAGGPPPAAPTPQPTPVPTSPPAPSVETPSEIAGAWQGPVGEEGLEYQVCMQVGAAPDSPNPIQYFGGLNCSGTARFVSSSGSVHTFAETLDVGSDTEGGECATTGKIETRLNSDGTLDWRWFDPDSNTPRATTLLKRQPACPPRPSPAEGDTVKDAN